MGDEAHGAFVSIQGVGQNLTRRDIQMIGRLVEKKEVGRPGKHPGNSDTGLFATGEHRYVLGDVVAAEEKRSQHPAQTLLRFVRCYAPQFFDDGVVRVERFYVVLGEVCRSHVVTDYALSALKWQDTGQHSQEGCLSRPIYTNEGGAVAALQYQVKVPVYSMLPVRLGNVLQFDYNTTAP